MKLIKNYLTSDELIYITSELTKIENPTQREITKIAIIYQLLVEDAPQLETCNEYYDLYMSQNDIDFELELKNIFIIDELIKETIGTTAIVKEFLNALDNKIDEAIKGLENINQEQLLGKMKEMLSLGQV